MYMRLLYFSDLQNRELIQVLLWISVYYPYPLGLYAPECRFWLQSDKYTALPTLTNLE